MCIISYPGLPVSMPVNYPWSYSQFLKHTCVEIHLSNCTLVVFAFLLCLPDNVPRLAYFNTSSRISFNTPSQYYRNIQKEET